MQRGQRTEKMDGRVADGRVWRGRRTRVAGPTDARGGADRRAGGRTDARGGADGRTRGGAAGHTRWGRRMRAMGPPDTRDEADGRRRGGADGHARPAGPTEACGMSTDGARCAEVPPDGRVAGLTDMRGGADGRMRVRRLNKSHVYGCSSSLTELVTLWLFKFCG